MECGAKSMKELLGKTKTVNSKQCCVATPGNFVGLVQSEQYFYMDIQLSG